MPSRKDSLIDSIGNYHMGMTAENISSKYSITREKWINMLLKVIRRRLIQQNMEASKEIVDIIVDNRKEGI